MFLKGTPDDQGDMKPASVNVKTEPSATSTASVPASGPPPSLPSSAAGVPTVPSGPPSLLPSSSVGVPAVASMPNPSIESVVADSSERTHLPETWFDTTIPEFCRQIEGPPMSLHSFFSGFNNKHWLHNVLASDPSHLTDFMRLVNLIGGRDIGNRFATSMLDHLSLTRTREATNTLQSTLASERERLMKDLSNGNSLPRRVLKKMWEIAEEHYTASWIAEIDAAKEKFKNDSQQSWATNAGASGLSSAVIPGVVGVAGVAVAVNNNRAGKRKRDEARNNNEQARNFPKKKQIRSKKSKVIDLTDDKDDSGNEDSDEDKKPSAK